jgi:SAM-dependent methyltransferase
MPRKGEFTYYERIGQEGLRYAVNKPFSEEQRGLHLMEVGALFSLLPPPPARVLECGCGTGWLTYFLAKSGYQAVGTDVSPLALRMATENPLFAESPRPEFVVGDWETLDYHDEFDAVIFFDSLHHSVDEQKAVRCAYRALRPGGVFIASETGVGHEAASREVMEKYDVTEKDMPPKRILKLGAAARFTTRLVYPRGDHLGRLLYCKPVSRWKALAASIWPVKYLAILFNMMFGKRNFGLVVMYK